jgi:predicted acyl esterase
MKLSSHLTQRLLHLPPPATRDLTVERDLRVPMRDGAVLLADRWTPKTGPAGLPTALLRIPYGRTGLIAAQLARPLAERGFQVLIQSTRGTFGSGGDFDPLRREREDGLDTLDWLVEQPWCGEAVVLYGGSYLGFAQWAVAGQLPPQVKALIPSVSESAFTLEFLRKESFSLEATFGWGLQVAGQERRGALLRQALRIRKERRAWYTLPLNEADTAAIGRRSDYFQDTLDHDADSPFWSALDHSSRVADITVPVSTVGGWFDIFLPGQLRDYQALQGAGREARLTVGPWAHISMGVGDGDRRGPRLRSGPRPRREAVRPRPGAAVRDGRGDLARLPVLAPAGLRPAAPPPPPRRRPGRRPAARVRPGHLPLRPGRPHPGRRRRPHGRRRQVGPRRQHRLEARPDVLTYTTPVLDTDVEVVGEVSAEIWFRSSLPYADVFVRLCDVDESGRSTNVCDGLSA